MKKKEVEQFLKLVKKSIEATEKKLDLVWLAIHTSAKFLLFQYRLYAKARNKKGKKPLDLKDWIDSGKPEK